MIIEREYVFPGDIGCSDEYLDERWCIIDDFPDYAISDYGRLWSLRSEKMMSPTPNIKSGHLDVVLRNDDHKVHKYIHRLVAEAFIENPYNLPVVRHLDDDPTNNTVSNLAWGTQLDNVHDAIDNGNNYMFTNRDREKAYAKRRKPVISINIETNEQQEFISQHEAARVLGIKQNQISSVILGKRKRVGKYKFVGVE